LDNSNNKRLAFFYRNSGIVSYWPMRFISIPVQCLYLIIKSACKCIFVKKIIILLPLILFLIKPILAQQNSNNFQKIFFITGDTIKIDTLSLIPGSVIIKDSKGILIDTSFLKINYADAYLILNKNNASPYSLLNLKDANTKKDSLQVSYKTFPYLFSSVVKHKDLSRIKPNLFGNTNPFSYTIVSKNDAIFKMEGLNKSGSISRGLSFGNSQNMVVNSNLNLQLSGHLNNNIDILLAATDNSIPFQPEGNTQQLQEFDKVFIQLSNENAKLIAGDFQFNRPESYFMNFHKKAQGINFSKSVITNKKNKNIKEQGIYKTSLIAAISRGKFARNLFQGMESNQGPYRLSGAEKEPFIIVLSGTEKVYINGKLLDRGQENDYTIDYNTSEITFTAKQLITTEKRIVVEFQYSDKNYARSLLHFGNDFENNNLKLHVNFYSEADSKNQPLQQDLSPLQQKLLSEIGDTLSLAITPSFDSVTFSNNEVLYKKMDTLIGTQLYSFFKYSTNADSARYRVSFSNVGKGNGNYNQIASSANGKVYEWISPLLGIKQGNYEAVKLLITPKQKQMITASADYAFSANTKLTIETAGSNNDINTFSAADSKDNIGYALKINFDNTVPFRKAEKSTISPPLLADSAIQPLLTLQTNVNYEYVQSYFSAIERFRSIEFDRDWNRENIIAISDQHILGAKLQLSKKGKGHIAYKYNALLEEKNYNAMRQLVNLHFNQNGFNINYEGSLLNSTSTLNTKFYRHKSAVSHKIKRFTLGFKDELEHNKFSLLNKDSLLSNSYQFWDWEGYFQNSDTTKNRYGINYKQRTSFAVNNLLTATSLLKSSFAENYGGFLELIKNPNNILKLNVAYRILKVDPAITIQKPDNSLVLRTEYNFRLWKGLIYSNSFYEIGSGLEVKKQFSYIEVAAGQGVFIWLDYNNNGIKELNEFEVATFPNTANYVKIYTPSLDYVKVYNNQFSQMLLLKPAAIWVNKAGIRKFISRFSNQSAFRIDRKSIATDNPNSNNSNLNNAYNPFLVKINDTSSNDFKSLITLNSSFRNSIFINQMNPIFGIDITYQDVHNKLLLLNGFDTRQNKYKEVRLRWYIFQKIWWDIAYKDGIKTSNSQYFSTRNFSIFYYEAAPKLNFQPSAAFRASLSFKFTDKNNNIEMAVTKSQIKDYGLEIKYNVLQKGSLNVKANFIQIKFDGLTNTSIAYEMMDAYQIGENITWGITYQRNLSNNLQLSLTYDGRKSENSNAIHTGGAQLRAYF